MTNFHRDYRDNYLVGLRCSSNGSSIWLPSGPTLMQVIHMGLKVWIDQDLCTGDGLCEEISPAVFALLDDGLAYVKQGSDILSDPGGAAALADIPDKEIEGVVESAEECPGECIFIEAG